MVDGWFGWAECGFANIEGYIKEMRTRYSNFRSLDFDDVHITSNDFSDIESRAEVNLVSTFRLRNQVLDGIPIVASNISETGTFKMAEALARHKIFTCLNKHYSYGELYDFFHTYDWAKQYCFISSGFDEYDKVKELYLGGFVNKIVFDVANGNMRKFQDLIGRARRLMPDCIIVAGNTISPKVTKGLIEAGADFCKVGVGGSVLCATRNKTGYGRGQLTAVDDCAEAAREVNGMVMSDGGSREPQDLGKAFCAGSKFVMIGSMLAGTDESNVRWYSKKCRDLYNSLTGNIDILNNEITLEQLKKEGGGYCYLHGEASKTKQEKRSGSIPSYGTSEGNDVYTDYKGPVDNIVKDILGGLRSLGAYLGASHISQFQNKAIFEVKG